MKTNFLGKLIIRFKLKVITGLHIGTGSDVGRIGEIDNSVVKLRLEEEGFMYPYIPGSSLKGKLRHLLELKRGKIDVNEGEVHKCNKADCEICDFFGSSDKGIGKAIFRDIYLTNQSKDKIRALIEKEGGLEVKWENVISRKTGKAKDLRQMERVPKGTEFKGEIVINIFDKDEIDQKVSLLKELFKLLEDDYLGGSGTRGYGKVKLNIKKIIFRSSEFYKDEEEEADLTEKFLT